MKSHSITAKCSKGHTQILKYDAGLDRDFVEMQAGLLDGTSPMYIHSPIGTGSVIGKCGICGSQISCSVIEDGPVANDLTPPSPDGPIGQTGQQ